MSEIAVRHDNHNTLDIPQPASNQGIARLVEWAQAADAAYKLADTFASSQMAPTAYRGKPAEAAAAILAGAELGFDPMASLRAFDNIQGTPAPKAITLRAVVQAAGHDIRIDKSTAAEAIVSGRRKGDPEWQTSTWTLDRATQMGLTGKAQWKQQPAAMLIARATSEVCRWIASDAIMGMPYSAEEIRDEGASYEPKPQARRVTAAEILGVQDVPAAQPAADEAADGDWQPAEPLIAVTSGQPITMMDGRQRKTMFALWRDLGFDGDEQRQNRLNITAKIIGLARPLESSSELTAAEADTVIAALRDRKAAQEQGQVA